MSPDCTGLIVVCLAFGAIARCHPECDWTTDAPSYVSEMLWSFRQYLDSPRGHQHVAPTQSILDTAVALTRQSNKLLGPQDQGGLLTRTGFPVADILEVARNDSLYILNRAPFPSLNFFFGVFPQIQSLHAFLREQDRAQVTKLRQYDIRTRIWDEAVEPYRAQIWKDMAEASLAILLHADVVMTPE